MPEKYLDEGTVAAHSNCSSLKSPDARQPDAVTFAADKNDAAAASSQPGSNASDSSIPDACSWIEGHFNGRVHDTPLGLG